MFKLTMDVAGVKQLNRGLGVIASAVKDLRPVWEDIYDDLLKRERTLFAQEGNIGSKTREMGEGAGVWGSWTPLNPVYAARKLAQGYGTKILVRTGRLKESLTQRSGADAVFEIGPKALAMGTKVPYAGYHQTGTRRMPAREPLRISEVQARHWSRLVHKFLIESGQFERENL